ncbi:hypothetical protein MVEN_00833800 [Mycena venus]|uniref:Uncharacterized protein n=1 Tax=Mycena venus TaxID=2733690 RepID=A0A8H6YGI1_9AGAR|nr:hypothetical protein MVEN_00833800 [Mycena venus]
MVQNSRCGLPLPLTASFDCVAYTTRPADIPALPNMTLPEKNKRNVAIEAGNTKSIDYTRAYEAARATTAGVGALDVGAPLLPYFEYSDDEKAMLVRSSRLVDAVGPLPTYMVEYIVTEQIRVDAEETTEKARVEKERADKEKEKLKANMPIIGTMRKNNPRSISSALSAPVTIPAVFLMTMGHQIMLPLHWFSNNILRKANSNPHSVPMEWITAQQTTALVKPPRVQVVDLTKMAKLHGGEEAWKAMTPSIWEECSKNLMAALQQLSVPQDPNNPEPTQATEYALHANFSFLHSSTLLMIT